MTKAEATNFFWHCLVATKVIDELPQNPATNGHALRAIRMATLCSAGKNGVEYASEKARLIKETKGKPWEQCGLIKEHIFPVSLIRARVQRKLESTANNENAEILVGPSDQGTQGLTAEVVSLFQQHPRAWQAARIIRETTFLAWITKSEDSLFDDKTRHGGISIRKCMPKGWTQGQDKFARYDACGIVLLSV